MISHTFSHFRFSVAGDIEYAYPRVNPTSGVLVLGTVWSAHCQASEGPRRTSPPKWRGELKGPMTRRPGHAPAARRMPWRLSRGRDRPRLFRRLPPSRDRASSERVTSGHGGGRQYASAVVSRRDGRRTHDDHACLGRVVDRERGVSRGRERGHLAFDVAGGERGRVPDGLEPDAPEDGGRSRPRTLSLGDAWVPGRLARRSGLWDVVDANSAVGQPRHPARWSRSTCARAWRAATPRSGGARAWRAFCGRGVRAGRF